MLVMFCAEATEANKPATLTRITRVSIDFSWRRPCLISDVVILPVFVAGLNQIVLRIGFVRILSETAGENLGMEHGYSVVPRRATAAVLIATLFC